MKVINIQTDREQRELKTKQPPTPLHPTHTHLHHSQQGMLLRQPNELR